LLKLYTKGSELFKIGDFVHIPEPVLDLIVRRLAFTHGHASHFKKFLSAF